MAPGGAGPGTWREDGRPGPGGYATRAHLVSSFTWMVDPQNVHVTVASGGDSITDGGSWISTSSRSGTRQSGHVGTHVVKAAPTTTYLDSPYYIRLGSEGQGGPRVPAGARRGP